MRVSWARCRSACGVQVVWVAVETHIGGRLAAQAPDETVDESPPFSRLKGNLEWLAPHAGERAIGQLQMSEQVANPQPVIRELDVGDQSHQPESQEDGT